MRKVLQVIKRNHISPAMVQRFAIKVAAFIEAVIVSPLRFFLFARDFISPATPFPKSPMRIASSFRQGHPLNHSSLSPPPPSSSAACSTRKSARVDSSESQLKLCLKTPQCCYQARHANTSAKS